MQSVIGLYKDRLLDGKPIYINWLKATRAERSAVRQLWASQRIELVDVNHETHIATYEGKSKP